MTLDEDLLHRAKNASARLIDAQDRVTLAKADYRHAIRRLYFAGGSLREIADALDLSHQRVHQIIEASGGTRGWKPRKKAATDLACSFCGLPKPAAGRLIAGPGVCICNRCVTMAGQVARSQQARQTERTRLEPTAPSGRPRCSFCGKPPSAGTPLVAGPGVRICQDCLRLCDEIIAEESA